MAFKYSKMNEGIILAKAKPHCLSICPPAKAGGNSWRRQFMEAIHVGNYGELFMENYSWRTIH